MEQIREVAMAYYTRSSAEKKQLAHEFFSALDVDGNGRVSLAEYKSVLGSDRHLELIDKNGDGTLDFEEVLSLYFMNKVSMRNCDACRCFLPGSYFSCVLCEKVYPSTYDLCCACFAGGKFQHHHSADRFMDDRSMRWLLIHFLQKVDAQPEPKLSSPPPSPPPVHQYNSRSIDYAKYASRAEKVKRAVDALNAAVNIGISTGGCFVM